MTRILSYPPRLSDRKKGKHEKDGSI